MLYIFFKVGCKTDFTRCGHAHRHSTEIKRLIIISTLTFAMESHIILIVPFISTCLCDWVLVSFVNPEANNSHSKNDERRPLKTPKAVGDEKSCPDFHNLTALGFASNSRDGFQSYNGLGISEEYVRHLIEENNKIPKLVPLKANFMSRLGENLMEETEKRIKRLFNPGRREARFTSFHFPTMEGSLMTISMLLFGVYLSKLIVKLLQSHYTKYNMPIRMMGGIKTPIFIMPNNRKARSMQSNVQKVRFLSFIDKCDSRFN